MKYFSTFSGIGGFELGIKQAYENHQCGKCKSTQNKSGRDGVQRPGNIHDCKCRDSRLQHGICVGYSEIDKYAIQVYNKHFNHKNYGDITTINATTLPEFDLLVGGFPCQSFSIAGKRGGFKDTRGTLFFEIARIVKQKQPRLLLLENVKGLLSHDKGGTFYTIISTLDELGYDCQWQVLNSKNHGVPQNRERVFIIGHLRGTSRPEVFPFGGADCEDTKIQYVNKSDKKDFRTFSEQGLAPALQARSDTHKLQQLNQPTHSNDRVYGTDGVSPTLNTMQGGNRQPFIPDDAKIRRLTPTECERLQGFPDDWTAQGVDGDISDTQRYKMCGNAVTVNVIEDIMKKLL